MFSYGFLGIPYQFRWDVLWQAPYGQWLLNGLLMTLKLTAVSWVFAVFLGVLFGTLRTVPCRPLRLAASAYVELFRNVPLLVWLFFWYFGAPEVLPESIRQWAIHHGIEYGSAVVGISIYHGARMSEVVRAGIQSIPKTQLESGLATGLSIFQAYRFIVTPIALRLVVPPVTNESLNLLKNSSLAMTIGVGEITFATRQIETYTARAFEAFAAGTLIYLALCLGIAYVMNRMERRFAIPGLIARTERIEH